MNIKRYNEINLVPLIDVLLVLLVIVLLTSTFVVHQVLKVELPVAKHSESANTDQQVVIVLDASGALYWHTEGVTLDEVSARLSALPIDTSIDIRVDANCPFSPIVALIDLLKSMQMKQFALHTKKDG